MSGKCKRIKSSVWGVDTEQTSISQIQKQSIWKELWCLLYTQDTLFCTVIHISSICYWIRGRVRLRDLRKKKENLLHTWKCSLFRYRVWPAPLKLYTHVAACSWKKIAIIENQKLHKKDLGTKCQTILNIFIYVYIQKHIIHPSILHAVVEREKIWAASLSDYI